MKLIINARFLTQQQSGVQHFATGMVKALQKKGIAFELIAPPGTDASAELNMVTAGPSNPFLWEQLFLPRYVKKRGALLLSFCNSAPLFLRSQAVTVHDLAFEQKNKGWFRPLFRLWYRLMIPRICKRSRLVFTVSGFSKKEIIAHYRIPEKKISILPNGLPVLPPVEKNRIRNSYFVMTGINNPRKNALEIFGYMDLIAQNGCKLIVLKNDADVFGRLMLPQHPSVTCLNNIPADEYFRLLKNAKALIYPSLYEGFGIPVLESLCLQTPVIASGLDVFRESFGDLPVYFTPGSRSSFAEALDTAGKKEISAEQAEALKKKYNFEHAASLLLDSLESLTDK